MPMDLDTPPELAARLATVGDGKLDDLALLPGNFLAFAREMRAANESTLQARDSITATLGQVADRLSDLATQQIQIVNNVSLLAGRVEMVEGALVALTTNLKDTADDLDSRVKTLQTLCAGLVHRVESLEAHQKLVLSPAPLPLVPGGLVTYLVLFLLCVGAGALVVGLQFLITRIGAS